MKPSEPFEAGAQCEVVPEVSPCQSNRSRNWLEDKDGATIGHRRYGLVYHAGSWAQKESPGANGAASRKSGSHGSASDH